MIKYLLCWVGTVLLSVGWAGTKVINVYQWSDYLPEPILQQFTQETGIRVNSSHYDSNEALYTKLKAMPFHDYDVIIPSSCTVDRMIQEDMLEPLDYARLSYVQHLDSALLNKSYDPGNRYSLPYLFNTTGLVVHQEYYSAECLTAWKKLWETRFLNKLLVLDDTRELFAVVLLVLGYSPNTQVFEEITAAYHLLRQLLTNVRAFNSEGLVDLYATEELKIGMGWSSDVYRASQINSQLRFIYPEEGYTLSIDSLAIPKGAPHLDEAHALINFLSRPDIAASISCETGYATANLTARQALPNAMRSNTTIYPSADILNRGIIPISVGKQAEVYQTYWEQLKI